MDSKTILLVEDNPSDIALTKRALEKANLRNELMIVEDGREALDYLFCEGVYSGRDITDLPALTLLDLKLPRVPGLEVLRRIRQEPRLRRMPVVILTSSSEEDDIAGGYDVGVNSYIRKPVDFKQFAEIIKHLGLYWLSINQQAPMPRDDSR